jgi:hypothetical protein
MWRIAVLGAARGGGFEAELASEWRAETDAIAYRGPDGASHRIDPEARIGRSQAPPVKLVARVRFGGSPRS